MVAKEHARFGGLEIAHQLLDEFAASGDRTDAHPGWFGTMLLLADVAIACDDGLAGAALYERLVPFADQLPWTGVVPVLPFVQGLGRLAARLHRYEEADGYVARAAAYAERASPAFFATETDLAWGEIFLQRRHVGDDQRAHTRLDAARSAAIAHGYAMSSAPPTRPYNISADSATAAPRYRRRQPCDVQVSHRYKSWRRAARPK